MEAPPRRRVATSKRCVAIFDVWCSRARGEMECCVFPIAFICLNFRPVSGRSALLLRGQRCARTLDSVFVHLVLPLLLGSGLRSRRRFLRHFHHRFPRVERVWVGHLEVPHLRGFQQLHWKRRAKLCRVTPTKSDASGRGFSFTKTNDFYPRVTWQLEVRICSFPAF